MTDEAALELQSVERRYGRKTAIRDVSFSIRPGEIVSLLGPNGAGKTTAIKIASTLLTPTAGRVFVRGVDAVRRPRQARQHLGLALGGDRGFYMRANVGDNLRFFAGLKGILGRHIDGEVLAALDRVGLGDRAGSAVEELSRGMRQRLHIARALLGDPTVILLDEPSTGLDPETAKELRELISELRSRGGAILLTTHYMREAEELADRILVLDRGMVAVEGVTADVSAAAGVTAVSTYRSVVEPSDREALSGLPGVADVLSEERNGAWTTDVLWDVTAPDEESVRIALGPEAQHVITRVPTLEEAYLAYLRRRVVEDRA